MQHNWSRKLTKRLALCWVHAGRHYEKLSPIVARHAKLFDRLHSKSERGARAMDVFTTLVQTSKKLRISAYDYLRDRISGRYAIPALARQVLIRAGT